MKNFTVYAILVIAASLTLVNSTTACAPPLQKETPLIGDLNGDGKVDMKDVAIVAMAFGSYPEHPRWNPDADINHDGVVSIDDLLIVLSSFGQTQAKAQFCPPVLNLKSRGKWITCRLQLSSKYSAREVNISSILLDNALPVDPKAPYCVGEHYLIVKFNRQALISHVKEKLQTSTVNCRMRCILLTITWKLYDGTRFTAFAKLYVIT